MSRNRLKKPLAWCLAVTILLPAVLALVLGLGRLLAALGDEAGATACDRLALFSGVLWAVAVVGATICNAALLMQTPPAGGRRRRRRAAMRRSRRAAVRRWRRAWRQRRRRLRRRRLREERLGRPHRGRGRHQERGEGEGRSDQDDMG